jgi:capsular exopolysaccharide synthesis family protein
VPGEGKSFCSINLAVALAQQGLRTLLLDADLRLGSIGEVLLGNAELAGVSDVLRARCEFDQAVHLTNIQNLSVMPAGARMASPAEILGGTHFADEVLRTALARFDRVIIDTAPVHAVSDTLLFARHADAVCLVVRAGKTPAPAVVRALGKLRDSGAKVLGAVLNSLPRRGGYYYHYQAPGYGRDEVYGASAAAGRR